MWNLHLLAAPGYWSHSCDRHPLPRHCIEQYPSLNPIDKGVLHRVA